MRNVPKNEMHYQEEEILKISSVILVACPYYEWMDCEWRDLKTLFIGKIVVKPP
jgi:hypothetical protein